MNAVENRNPDPLLQDNVFRNTVAELINATRSNSVGGDPEEGPLGCAARGRASASTRDSVPDLWQRTLHGKERGAHGNGLYGPEVGTRTSRKPKAS